MLNRSAWFTPGFVLTQILISACVALGSIAPALANPALEDFSVSPDGQTVAFEFTDTATEGGHWHGLGLYEWQTGNLTRIPNPSNGQLSLPSFCWDGRHLAAVLQLQTPTVTREIATIDLPTGTITEITHDSRLEYKESPIFQPNTSNILYVAGGIGHRWHLMMVDAVTGKEQVALGEDNGFIGHILRPFFVNDDIYFTGIAPSAPPLIKDMQTLGLDSSAMVAYRMHPGRAVEIAFPKSEVFTADQLYHFGLLSLASSPDGATFVFIGRTNSMATGAYAYDLFRLTEDGKFTRLTHSDSIVAQASISGDGSFVAFSTSLNHKRLLDLQILNLNSRVVIHTGLLEMLSYNPAFQIH